MGRASTRLRGSGDRLAAARDRFLACERVDPAAVRKPILASWWRSREWNVAANRLDMSYQHAPDLDSILARAAEPVLRRLHEQLDGQPISVVLTDAAGLVLLRYTADRDLERHLDSIMLAPGFSYAEDVVGTNGIGTALESGGPAHVFGHEHYAERLEGMACAGAPIRDAVSGKTVGVIDLTCWRRDADPLMISLVQSTAGQINASLAAVGSSRDMRLLQEYQRACRHSGGIVLALGHDVVMMNDLARQTLSPGDQAALISQAIEGATTVDLPSGALARLFPRAVAEENPARDLVVHVKLDISLPEAAELTVPRHQMSLPGLVGGGPAWLRACHSAEVSYERGEWLTIEGERGVGKLALMRAVHQRHNPAMPFHVFDVAGAETSWLDDVRRELLEGSGMLVIRHVDALNGRQARGLTAVLHEAAGRSLRVAVTLDRGQAGADLTALLRLFPHTVAVPPLRHHSEDLRELVPFFLGKLSQQGRVRCSSAAMQLLLRHPWPGNTAQLWEVLKRVVQHCRAGSIQPQDLPPECWTVSRRVLSTLESIERDAIVQSLLDNEGNKIQAAQALGMSRATIYRRIREYGIVMPQPG
jgi:transcriptional regulator of acetoin/glycerol metabolism